MRLTTHPPEKRAQAKWLGETTTLNCTEIAARVDASPSIVRTWKANDRWKRPTGAPEKRTFAKERREAIARLRGLGGTNADIARVAECSPDTVARIPPVPPKGAKARAAAAPPGVASEEAARLHEALTAEGLGRRELLRLIERAFVLVAADAIAGRDPLVDRRAQALARTAATVRALPDDAPAAGDSLHDQLSVPATFEETNLLLEELARRFAAFDRGGVGGAAPGEPAAGGAAAPA
ncbi:MAG TPA: phage terminase small subunit-related protein [Beijerinckiaceae bacterium]|jgi:hypothetical protein